MLSARGHDLPRTGRRVRTLRPAGDDRMEAAAALLGAVSLPSGVASPGRPFLAERRVFWHHRLPLPINGILGLGDLALW